MKQNELVNLIFDATRKAEATPQQRKSAVIRAGLVAQAYNDSDCIEEMFSSLTDGFNNEEKPHSISLSNDRG
jgi:hypothetical protein